MKQRTKRLGVVPASGVVAAAAIAAVVLGGSVGGATAGGKVSVAFDDGTQERMCEADLMSHTHLSWGAGDPGHKSPEEAATAYLDEARELNLEALSILDREDPARADAMRELIAPSLERTLGEREAAKHDHSHDADHSHGHMVFFDQRAASGVLQSRIVVGEIAGGFVVMDDYQCTETAVASIEAYEAFTNTEVAR